MRKFMRILAKVFPVSATGENVIAVKAFKKIDSLKNSIENCKLKRASHWPVMAGSYEIVNEKGQIAVCTLTSEQLFLQSNEAIAIIGKVYTPNLGIELIIKNVISNPNIRYFLLCGKDSPIFHVGQAVQCLFIYGVDQQKRIQNAIGHFPVLQNVTLEEIDHFLKQVELVDCCGETRIDEIEKKLAELHNCKKEPFKQRLEKVSVAESFITIKPGGKRIPIEYDKKGFFIITVNEITKEIIVKHYDKAKQPCYISKGRSAEAILLALLEKGLVSQLSHSGYLGAELAKAEAALRLNLIYEQDKFLKNK